MNEEEKEITCCGVEITTVISDNGLCPICYYIFKSKIY